jgi:hypothetical protein
MNSFVSLKLARDESVSVLFTLIRADFQKRPECVSNEAQY